MNFTQEQYDHLKKIWHYAHPGPHDNLDYWIKFLCGKGDDKDIKKINQTLTYFQDYKIPFKDTIIETFHANSDSRNVLPNFAFCTLFNFLKTNNLVNDSEIPIDSIINGLSKYTKKSRYHRENQIKFLLLFPPTESLLNTFFEFYTEIHQQYTIDLPEQKKILKTFNSYAGEFVKTLDNSTQIAMFKKLDFICSGLNNSDVKDILVNHDEEFSFKFIISCNNSMSNASQTFNRLATILEIVIDKMPKDQISDIMLKNLNAQSKLGVLKFQYAFFSKDKTCIDKYSQYFKEFNDIMTNNALSGDLSTESYYVDLFNKICFKNKISDKLAPKNTSIKTNKI